MSRSRRVPVDALLWGSDPLQTVDVYRPDDTPRGVVALIHGGFWQSAYGRDLFADHAVALQADGFAVGNLAYRRVGDRDGRWPNTGADVVAGLNALVEACGPLTAVVGHSAGGQLALWAAKELTPRPAVVISVAGCDDLALAQQLHTGRGAVESLVGEDLRWLADADPSQRVPLGVATKLIVADGDRVVPNELSESYAGKASASGDDVEVQVVAGDHFSVLDVTSAVWAAVVDAIKAVA